LEIKAKSDWRFMAGASVVFLLAIGVSIAECIIRVQVGRFSISMLIAGLVLFTVGVSLRIVARRALGKFFTVTLKVTEEQRLVTNGIYKHIRHPAYTGSLLGSLGYPLMLSSWWGFLAMFLNIPFFLYRIHIEEKMLVEGFGDEYRRYQKQSKKLIPFVY